MLGAVAALAVGFLFAAPAAHAYTHADCIAINPSEAQPPPAGNYDDWPEGVEVCYESTNATFSRANLMFTELNGGGLSTFGTDLKNRLKGERARFYFFKTKDDFLTYFDERFDNPPNGTVEDDWQYEDPGDDVGGVSYYDGANGVIYSAVFQRVVINGVLQDNPDIAWTTAHEAGHWANAYYASLTGMTSKVSLSSKWAAQIVEDFININSVHPCKLGPPSNEVGFFTGKKDQAGNFICTGGTGTTLAAPYSSLADNEAILNAAWPQQWDTITIFVDEVARRTGNHTSMNNQYYALPYNAFGCTQRVVQEMIKFNRLPTVTEMNDVEFDGSPANCSTTGFPTSH